MHNDVWLKGQKAAADYIGVSLSTWKRLRGSYPVKVVKLPTGTVLYKTSWLDAFLEQWTEDGCEIDRIVDELLN
jgi:hypothetical protein